MNDAVLIYRIDWANSLRYLLIVALECYSEAGILPEAMYWQGIRLRYDRDDLKAVLQNDISDEEYVRRNRLPEVE